MNILREVRRVKEKSMATRIRLLLTFAVILIINTYAWHGIDKDGKLKGLEASVTPWDVSYYVNEDKNEILDQIATFTIEDLYPGMPEREDIVHVYNMGTTSTNITYELISVKVFGQEVLPQLQTDGEIQTTGTTTNIFSKDTQYPFNISYTYDRVKLIGEYVDDKTTPRAHATFKFNVNWTYEGQGTVAENLAKDALDTKFGKDAYAYYQDEENDPTKAIEIKVKITSNMIHPSVDPDHPDYGT